MQERRLNYVIRDQDGDAIRPLDLLQAWGAPLRPPIRARVGTRLVRLGLWIQGAARPADSATKIIAADGPYP